MKSRSKESGSIVHIIVIVILAVAVLGLVGFVFWQNFIDKPIDTSTSTQQITDNNQADDSKEQQTLVVSEWRVKGVYSNDTTINYTVNQFGSLTMSAPSLPSECALGSVSRGIASDDAVVGSTFSGKTTKEAYELGYGDARSRVGDYYYLYTGPQTACDDIEGQDAAVNAVKDFVTSLTSE